MRQPPGVLLSVGQTLRLDLVLGSGRWTVGARVVRTAGGADAGVEYTDVPADTARALSEYLGGFRGPHPQG